MRIRMAGLVMLAVASAACTSGDRDGVGGNAPTDSAGITIVPNTAVGAWEAGGAWRVVEDLVIGLADGDANYQFGMITGICVLADRRIYVVDQVASRISGYSSEGEFLHAFGESGNGPGQMGSAVGPCLEDAADTLLVPDLQNLRINRFLPSGAFLETFPLDLQLGLPVVWSTTSAGRIVQQLRSFGFGGQPTTDSADAVVVLGADGTVADTLLAFPTGKTLNLTAGAGGTVTFFASEPAWSLAPDGGLYYGTTDEFSISTYDRNGRLMRIVRKSMEARAVDESDQVLVIEAMTEGFRQIGAPPAMAEQLHEAVHFAEFYPAFHRLHTGPGGSLWVQRVMTPGEMTAEEIEALGRIVQNPQGFVTNPHLPVGAPDWDVFDADGRYLGVVTMPSRFTPLRFIGDEIYGVGKDDLDVDYVIRLSITRS
jgi:hypothetical protein